MKQDISVTALLLMAVFEKSFVEALKSLHAEDRIDEESFADYKVFRSVAKEVFEETGNFSTDIMLEMMPSNKFTHLYIQYCAEQIKARGEKLDLRLIKASQNQQVTQ